MTEADGTARIERVIPLPQSLSPEAKAWLSRPTTADAEVPQTIEQRRAMLQRWADYLDELRQGADPVTPGRIEPVAQNA